MQPDYLKLWDEPNVRQTNHPARQADRRAVDEWYVGEMQGTDFRRLERTKLAARKAPEQNRD